MGCEKDVWNNDGSGRYRGARGSCQVCSAGQWAGGQRDGGAVGSGVLGQSDRGASAPPLSIRPMYLRDVVTEG